MSDAKAAAYRRGMYVFVALVILTIIEYFVGVALNSAVLLFILALLKAALIVQFFMHIYRLWREEAH